VAQHFLLVGTLDVDGKKLPVRPVQREPECEPPIPPSSVILVSWSHVGLKEKFLKMYLENQRRSGGGQVKDLRFFAEEKKAYVRFVEECELFLLMLNHMKNTLVYLLYTVHGGPSKRVPFVCL